MCIERTAVFRNITFIMAFGKQLLVKYIPVNKFNRVNRYIVAVKERMGR